MKLIALALALSLLCGCASPLVPNEYSIVSEHSDTTIEEQSDALSAETYDELTRNILTFVESGTQHGVIHVYNYDGDVTKDISSAVYEVWKNDPIGAYAVEFITTDCNLLLSYYEIRVEITYRADSADLSSIQYVRGTAGARDAIESTLSAAGTRLTLRISAFDEDADWDDLVESYCVARPETIMETPKVSVSVYPDSGSTRILDLRFQYEHTAVELASMQTAVGTVLNSAVNYVRYRKEVGAKAELLYTYLMERFDYTEAKTGTPAYSLLCEGVADSQIFSQVFQILCDRIGLPCQIVSGYLDGESYYWNIVEIDGNYCHVDLMRGVREGIRELTFYADQDLSGYSWDRTAYPVCEAIEPEPATTEPEVTEPPSETTVPPSETTEPQETTTPPITTEPQETTTPVTEA